MSSELVTVATFAHPVEANLAKNRLEESGVQAFLANEETFEMDWLLGNAVGWIRLEVGNEDANAARAVLSRLDETEAGRATGLADGQSAIDETEPLAQTGPEDTQNEDGADDSDPVLTSRDRDAERAFRGAVLGAFFFPIQFYVFYLVVKVFISEQSLGDRQRRKAIIAAVISFFTLTGVYFFFRGR